MEDLMRYVKPELLVLIPVLYFVGLGLKKCRRVQDCRIPLLLGLCGVVLSLVYVLSTTPAVTGWRSILGVLFTAVTQGVLAAGCSVYVNQLVKQTRKKDE